VVRGYGTEESFSWLFGIARANDALVVYNMELLSGFIQWNVSFVREMHDCEVNVFASFLQVLHLVKIAKIGFSKSLPKEACLKSSHSLAHWLVPKVVTYHGRVCGELKIPQMVFFFFFFLGNYLFPP